MRADVRFKTGGQEAGSSNLPSPTEYVQVTALSRVRAIDRVAKLCSHRPSRRRHGFESPIHHVGCLALLVPDLVPVYVGRDPDGAMAEYV